MSGYGELHAMMPELQKESIKAHLAIAVYELAVRAYFYRKKYAVKLQLFELAVKKRMEQIETKVGSINTKIESSKTKVRETLESLKVDVRSFFSNGK
jgi:hypothetical protein